MLVAIVAAGGGCKRATLGGAPDGGVITPTGDGGVAVAGDGGTVIGADGPGAGDRNAPLVDAGADGSATDALHWLPPGGLYHCPSVPSVPSCPADRPAEMSACPLAGITCEYGGRDIACRSRWICADDLTWQPAKAECADALATRCPDQAPAGGSACDVDAYCSYPAHTVCSCNSALGYWVCQSVFNVPAGCPDELPFYGAPCEQDQLVCRYNLCIGYTAICCGGTWVPMLVGACSE